MLMNNKYKFAEWNYLNWKNFREDVLPSSFPTYTRKSKKIPKSDFKLNVESDI